MECILYYRVDDRWNIWGRYSDLGQLVCEAVKLGRLGYHENKVQIELANPNGEKYE